ncbi:MAG: YeeE/YedE family protein [Usitatibacter sp.]
MQIDWAAFTPGSAVLGGLLIGAAATMFALLAGRIAGISGIVGGLLRPRRGDIAWRVAFVAGMLATPALYEMSGGRMSIAIDASNATLVAAGLLVGWGTRAGSGCTSGHGVCGLARRSPRSLAATLAFMAAGFLTVFAVRHLVA